MPFILKTPLTRKRVVFLGLSITLIALLFICTGLGAVHISPLQVASILGRAVHLPLPENFAENQEAILLSIRLPRVLLGCVVGAGLASAGAAMQGLFRNPLADPGLIGVSSASALAAAVVILMEVSLFHGNLGGIKYMALPLAAFAGALISVFFVYWLSTEAGRISVSTMLLTGIAVNALCEAGIGLMSFLANDAQLRNFTFWRMGSLGGASWTVLGIVGPIVLVAIFLIAKFSRALNTFGLGETEAAYLGTSVEGVKFAVISLSALIVGVVVSASGIIGFVGLVVPHLIRLVLGPDHRWLFPGSALAGACLILGADLLARTVFAPAELPIGIVTAAIGAPFFLVLLLRHRRTQKWT